MNNKLILGVLIVLLVIGVVFFVRNSQQNYQVQDSDEETSQLNQNNQQSQGSNSNTGSNIQDEQTQTTPSDSGKIPLSELSQHDSKTDCWIAYDGKVYDITSFLPKHPGSSAAIEPYCGSADEFTKAFEKKHGKSKVGMLMKVGTFMGDFDVMGNI